MTGDVTTGGEQTTSEHPPGWHANPDGPGLRYWDGDRWTDSYHPGPTESVSPKEVLWGLSLGFGAAGGVVGFLSIPIIAFYWPLGLGVAGVALAIAAVSAKGETPWYAVAAVVGSVAALVLGISAYGDFDDAQQGANNAQQELEDLLDRP